MEVETAKCCYFIVTPHPERSQGVNLTVGGKSVLGFYVKFGDGEGKRYDGTNPDFRIARNYNMRWAKAFEGAVLQARGFKSVNNSKDHETEWYVAYNNATSGLPAKLASGLSRFPELDLAKELQTTQGLTPEIKAQNALLHLAQVMMPYVHESTATPK